ncbi:MAG: hypothetical protein HKN48_10335 [Flavobacteriaceae bacterium]|nr:hypothetical protein [Flavobacteriaceae bacterium]
MKKNILILGILLIALSILSFSYTESTDNAEATLNKPVEKTIAENDEATKKLEKRIFPNFIYDIGPRFTPIKKSKLDRATSIKDFLSEEEIGHIVSYQFVSITVIENDEESNIKENGDTPELNKAQLALLKNSGYSTHLKIRTEYLHTHQETGELEHLNSTPHFTVVPEKQAKYVHGMEQLKDYFTVMTQDELALADQKKLMAAKLFFTVTKDGTIENVSLDRSSNYPNVDQKMIELMTEVPGTWKPAENSQGEKVDQELVVSFGLRGC